MFKIHRQSQNVHTYNKSLLKLYDHKRDIPRRLKHFKIILDIASEKELQRFYDKHYSVAFYVYLENFLLTDTNIKLKASNRSQKDEPSFSLDIFESILIHLPDLIHQRWQYRGFEFIISKLLHPRNTLKMRKEGLHFFLLWIRCLRENTLPQTHLLYECIVPGFTSHQPVYNIHKFFKSQVFKGPTNPMEIVSLVPLQNNDDADLKINYSHYFFNSLLELMAVKVQTLKWKDSDLTTIKSFSFLWDLFVTNYVLKIFNNFNFSTSIYSPCLDLPEVSESSTYSAFGSVLLDSTLTRLKVSVIKWVATFTGSLERSKAHVHRHATDKSRVPMTYVAKQLQELEDFKESRSGITVNVKSPPNEVSSGSNSDQSIRLPDTYSSVSNTSTLTAKLPRRSSMTSLDDKLQSCTSADEWIIQSVLFSTKKNVNLIQELFRQAFLLPITEDATIKRVIHVYQHWIQDKEVPIFMQYPPSLEDMHLNGSNNPNENSNSSNWNSTENITNSTAGTIKAAQICAGPESTYQLFITNSAYLFLVPQSADNSKSIRTQVDLCKGVLNVFRYMVVNVYLAQDTWIQLLRILLHIIKKLLGPSPPRSKKGASKEVQSFASKLAGPLFQTIIVTLVKANLSVPVSRDLWDETLDVLSSRCDWPEVIVEWGRNMEIMTRVLSRYVYNLELSDLPLDRLTEQKNKRQPKSVRDATSKLAKESLYEQAFKRAVGRRSISFINDISNSDSRKRSFAFPVIVLESKNDDFSGVSQPNNSINLSVVSAISPVSPSDLPPRKGSSDPHFTSTSPSESNVLRSFSSVSEICSKSSTMLNDDSKIYQDSLLLISRDDIALPKSETCFDLTIPSLSEAISDSTTRLEEFHGSTKVQKEAVSSIPDDAISDEGSSVNGNLRDFPRNNADDVFSLGNHRVAVKSPYLKQKLPNSETISLYSTTSSNGYIDWHPWEEHGILTPQSTIPGLTNSSPKPKYKDGFRILPRQPLESRDRSMSLSDISAMLQQEEQPSGSLTRLSSSASDQVITYGAGLETTDGRLVTTSPTIDTPLSHLSGSEIYRIREALSTVTSEADAILPEIPEEDEDLDLAFGTRKRRRKAAKKPAEDVVNNCGTLTGGSQTGWSAPVAVVMWRRLLGILGDVNHINDPANHSAAFHHLLDIWGVLFKMRQNIGVSDGESPSVMHELVPPLTILSPWAFEATMNLPDSHREGKLQALQLLCKTTLQRQHDPPLEQEHLAQFYALLHETLHSKDQEVVNKVIKNCSLYFTYCLPGATLLVLDFIHAVNRVCSSSQSQTEDEGLSFYHPRLLHSSDQMLAQMVSSQHRVSSSSSVPVVEEQGLRQRDGDEEAKAPRVEAQTILGSILVFRNVYKNLPIIKPGNPDPTPEICLNLKDHIIGSLLNSCKTEPVHAARCVALSSAGLWLYEELTSNRELHPRVKEAIDLLLITFQHASLSVVSAACFQLRLLTQCMKNIINVLPDVPRRVLEVISLTIITSIQNHDGKKSEEVVSQLVVQLLMCVLDWCMVVPPKLLEETTTRGGRVLLKLIITAVETASQGKLSSTKASHSFSNMASQENDPSAHLARGQDSTSGLKVKIQTSKQQIKKNGITNMSMKLAANLVFQHLTNHLGQFPLANGSSVLSSLVSENHDLKNSPKELTPELFRSPEVQFFTCDEACLISIVETPNQETSSEDLSSRVTSGDRCVRFIVRHPGGKFCWDCFVLYGPSNIDSLTEPIECDLPRDFDDRMRQTRNKFTTRCDPSPCTCSSDTKLADVPLPMAGEPPCEGSTDDLDQLLQHLSSTSRECRFKPSMPLNVPAPSPPLLNDTAVESDTLNCLLKHHQDLHQALNEEKSARLSLNLQNGSDQALYRGGSEKIFQYARLFCNEFGFLSRSSRQKIHLLSKNERLLRELKNLDSRNCRETHKVALFYIANGQEDKVSILSNTGGSKDYEDFVAGLGWEVDLKTHKGFRGKLQSDGSTGKSCPYYATSTLEVIFHVATRFPSGDAAINVKIRHLGNDEVHIVWSEHHRDYRRGIIPTEFGDVLIVIYPIKHRLFRIQIIKKQEIPYFGPLFDGAVVDGRVLPVLVRETAINAGRAKRSLINLYQPFYEERTRYLQQIVSQFKEKNTFEEYCAGLYRPAPLKRKMEKLYASKESLVRTSPELMRRHNTNNSSASIISKRYSNPYPSPRTNPVTPVASGNDVGGVGSSIVSTFGVANSVSSLDSQKVDPRGFSTSCTPPTSLSPSSPSPGRLESIMSEHAATIDTKDQK